MTTDRPKRRRWFQFRLRTLLIAILILSLPLSWFAVRLQRARRQREAVAAIEGLGGNVQYERPQGKQQPVSSWLRDLLGRDFFDRVTLVYLQGNVTNADLEHLTALLDLERLMLRSPQITDAGLKHLQGMSNLRYLTLISTSITDAGLTHLEGLPNLQGLTIDDADVTLEGVEDLRETHPDWQIDYTPPQGSKIWMWDDLPVSDIEVTS